MTKNVICTAFGAIGAFIANCFGGWDASIITLLIFIAIDYTTGIICAAVFHKSGKSESGSLKSNACFKGLCRKGMILLLVLVGARLDIVIGSSYIRDGICIAFILNELISITENAVLMGVPIPKVVLNSIEILKNKENK